MKTLSFPMLAGLSLWAHAALAEPTIVLVRHAELEGQRMVQPADTPLSEEGRTRAQRLAQLLSQADVARVYASDSARTQQTAEPVALLKSVPVTVVPKTDTAQLVQALRQDGDAVVLVVAHSDTLPAILAAIGGPTDLKIGAREFGFVFIVTPRPGQAPAVMRLAY